MEIKINGVKKSFYRDLVPGDGFIFLGNFYIKADTCYGGTRAAVKVENGLLQYFYPGDKVEPVKTLTVEV
ncbi:MAG: hypothetical protein ACXACY_13320 [Candidatus Hodarchaeales archaeon]|jgi:hypothetical protein